MAWRIAFVLLAGKLIATIASYGFGGCGGIFSPNLFLGAMAGIMIAGLGGKIVLLNRSDELLLAIGGMSACLGAVVQAPVTAILIIFEMTHQFAVVPGLMLAGLVSQALARTLQRHNFYDEVLLQDGHQLEHLIPPRDLRTWQNLPVSTIANFDPVIVSDLSEVKLRVLLEQHPYRHFPVVENGTLKGIAARSEIERALVRGGHPRIEPARTCTPNESIRVSQREIIESTTGTIAIVRKDNGELLAFLTLHDLLRAQVSMAEREGIT
jgi:CIC family chloride channel protein